MRLHRKFDTKGDRLYRRHLHTVRATVAPPSHKEINGAAEALRG